MAITHARAYVKQISLYLNNEDYEKAHSLSREFVAAFKDNLPAHTLLALSAYRVGEFDEAAKEGRTAFNMTNNPDDMLACALITALAYYDLGEFEKGYEILSAMEKSKKTDGLESLLVIFALALNSPDEAFRHYEELHTLNKDAAEGLLFRIVEGMASQEASQES